MELSRTDKTLIHLSLISGVGPMTVQRLLRALTREQLPQIYACSVADLQRWGIEQATAHQLVAGLAGMPLLDKELQLLVRYQARFISLLHEQYPALLQHTYAPPIGLYVQGNLPHSYAQSLAIVGSRKANNYGQCVIEKLVPPLVAQGWSIISGGALGADALAHAATVRAGGVTVAVIGSGLAYPYPATNRHLFQEILDAGGALVSPFPLTMQAAPGNFPARNRIIAGMTRGCVVIQAAAKSGALITADIALKEGRDVFAVPGPLFDELSEGCHELLHQGAHIVRSAADILQVYGFAHVVEKQQHEQGALFETAVVETDPFLHYCREPRSLDELLLFARCNQQQLYDKVWEYQIAGRLEETGSGKWQSRGGR